jgi:hypothetical protein
MFTKAKVAFTNAIIFGSNFKPNIDTAFCVVSRMLFEGKINVDGSIDPDKAGIVHKHELWSYIYYLYYHNFNIIVEFKEMQDEKKQKASAVKFYDIVKRTVNNPLISKEEVVPFDISTLIFFVNYMVHTYGMNMMNPVVVYLQGLMSNKEAMAKLKSFTLVTGRPPNEVEVISDPEKLSAANITVRVVEKEEDA